MRILVADDHPLYREALCLRLERLLAPVEIAEAGTLGDVLQHLAPETQPFDLILVDFWMPGLGLGPGIRQVLAAAGSTPVVLVSGGADPQEVKRAIDAGVRGYLPKTMPSPLLDSAISMLVKGGTYVPIELLTELAQRPAAGQAMPEAAPEIVSLKQSLIDVLTPREHKVLLHLATGASNKEIGRDLSLAEVTVKLHVRQILRKINARNRSEAASIATRAGLL
jgi:two-component system, NarL family, nitrate/nitrite response regulator NarL